MIWKFYDAHKEKIYQTKVRTKKIFSVQSSGQMDDNDAKRKI